ncbi:hypothetical protein OBBRIDRAFT_518566 [Obba rivulosa]|uniref:RING-type domain-containing protein n=1 Tax=Obba rivulosa TaxID=1052685 RepID=A0A8E2DM32_9APHY|nr:hypothetical protein OBBRIDRAFT_518566 [Obba rivulosa]
MSSTSDCTDSVPDTPSVHDSGSTSLEHGTTARHEEPVTSSHADHAEDGSDSMPGLASISDSESEWSTDDENAREEVRADDSDGGLPRLQSVSDSSEEVTDWGEEDYEDSLASEATGYFDEEDIGEYDAAWVHALLGTNNEDSLSSSRDVVAFLQRVFSSQSAAVDNDPLRAKTLLDGLELVSEDLIRRYESIRCGNGDSDVGCSICRDAYIESMPDFEVEAIVYSAALPYHPSPPQVYAFPCPGKHLFHGECLAPWLARKTTCPTCRFDIDPDSLTLRIQGPVGTAPSEMSTRMLWEPPKTVSLKEWIEVQERSGAVLDSEHHPVDISCASRRC